MKYISFLLPVLPLLLSACAPQGEQASLEWRLQNPLFAEMYAESVVDRLVELEIQEDPIIQEEGVLDRIHEVRDMWLDMAKDARRTQREGSNGQFVEVGEFIQGEALYLGNMLYLGPHFLTSAGPKLQVYLTRAVDPRDVDFPDESAVLLGDLDSTFSAQRYVVPQTDAPELLRTVVIWEDTFDRIYGFAQLQN